MLRFVVLYVLEKMCIGIIVFFEVGKFKEEHKPIFAKGSYSVADRLDIDSCKLSISFYFS